MTNIIYVFTDPLNESLNQYKVGSHKGTLNQLRSRYITGLPKLIVRYFIKTKNAKIIEDRFKILCINSRILNNGNLSEWVIMPLDEIFRVLCLLMNKNQVKIDGATNIIDFDNEENKVIQINEQLQTINTCIPQMYINTILSDGIANINLNLSITRDGINVTPFSDPNDAKKLNDESRLNILKQKGIKYRKTIGECTTPEEVERYRLSERTRKRRSRQKQNNQSTDSFKEH